MEEINNMNIYHKEKPARILESDSFYKKQGFGEPLECDPMMTGRCLETDPSETIACERRHEKGRE